MLTFLYVPLTWLYLADWFGLGNLLVLYWIYCFYHVPLSCCHWYCCCWWRFLCLLLIQGFETILFSFGRCLAIFLPPGGIVLSNMTYILLEGSDCQEIVHQSMTFINHSVIVWKMSCDFLSSRQHCSVQYDSYFVRRFWLSGNRLPINDFPEQIFPRTEILSNVQKWKPLKSVALSVPQELEEMNAKTKQAAERSKRGWAERYP